jgi:diguanylate cyclase (GGDEF)-like protein/PAS domain S-box-containing protein
MLKLPLLHEIASQCAISIGQDCLLSVVHDLIKNQSPEAIIVVEQNHPVGIITELDILRSITAEKNNSQQTVASAIRPNSAVFATKDLSFLDAYTLLLNSQSRYLILLDEQQEFAGVLCLWDFIFHLSGEVFPSEMTLEQLPEFQVQPVFAKDMLLSEAILKLDSDKINALLVYDDHDSYSVATTNAILRNFGDSVQGRTVLSAASKLPRFSKKTPVLSVIKLMHFQNLPYAAVLDEQNQVSGIVDEQLIFKQFQNLYIKFLTTIVDGQFVQLNEARKKLNNVSLLEDILRDSIDQAVIATDIDGFVLYVNPDAANLTRIKGNMQGYHLSDIAAYLGLSKSELQIGMAANKRGDRYTTELQRKKVSFEQILNITFAPLVNESGIFCGYTLLVQDVTEQKQSIEILQKSANIFENTLEGMIITDEFFNIESVNPAFSYIMGYSEHEVIGKHPSVFSSGHEDSLFFRNMRQQVLQKGFWQGEVWNRHKNGDILSQWLTINAINDSNNGACQYIGVYTDISTLKRSHEKYEFLAHHDPLTELPNRLLFQARLEQALKHGKRQKDKVAVLMLDVDNFKPVNDNWGHHVGDMLLQEIAKRMVATIRSDDTAARMGGDEFVVLLESVRTHNDAAAIAEKLVKTLSQPYYSNDHMLKVSVSIGVAMSPQDGEDVDILLKRADLALYSVKSQGRNAYQFYKSNFLHSA